MIKIPDQSQTNETLNKNQDGEATDFPLTAAIPAGQTCTGTVAGQDGVCLVRCQNSARAGPFGGVVPVQMAPAAGGAAGGAGAGAAGDADANTNAGAGANNDSEAAGRRRSTVRGLMVASRKETKKNMMVAEAKAIKAKAKRDVISLEEDLRDPDVAAELLDEEEEE